MSLPADIVATATVLVEECDCSIDDLKQAVAEAILQGLPEDHIRRLQTVCVGMASTRGKAWRLKGECGAAMMTGQVERKATPQQQEILLELPAIAELEHRSPTGRPPRHPVPDVSRLDLAAGERPEQ